jgi:hypothetical protein
MTCSPAKETIPGPRRTGPNGTESGDAPGPGRRAQAMRTLATLLAAATFATAAGACGYDAGSAAGLTVAHPSSIPVAMAIGAAVSAGELKRLPELPPALALFRANGAMRAFATSVATAPMPPMAIVLVEAHLWGRATHALGEPGFVPHTAGPEATDAVLVTGEPVLRALLEGRLRWDTALAAGLVVVDGPPAARDDLAALLRQRFS